MPPTRTRPATSAAVRPVRTAIVTRSGRAAATRARRRSARRASGTIDGRARVARPFGQRPVEVGHDEQPAGTAGQGAAIAGWWLRGPRAGARGPPRASRPADDGSRLDVHPRHDLPAPRPTGRALDGAGAGGGHGVLVAGAGLPSALARGRRAGSVGIGLLVAGAVVGAASAQASTAAAGRGRTRGSPRAPAPRRRPRPRGRPRSTGDPHPPECTSTSGWRRSGGPLLPCRSHEPRSPTGSARGSCPPA